MTNFSLYSNTMVQIILQHQIIYLKISQTEGSLTSVDNSKHGCGCGARALSGQTSGRLCPLYEKPAFVFTHVCSFGSLVIKTITLYLSCRMTTMNQREKPELFLTENTGCSLSSPGSSLRSWQTQGGLVNSQTLSPPRLSFSEAGV